MFKQFVFLLLAVIWVNLGFTQGLELELLSNWKRSNLPIVKNQIYNDVWGWEDENGREYVILGSLDSIYFIEITFPEAPVLRDVKAGRSDTCIHRDFKTYKNYCYAVADEGSSSLQIFDLSYLPDSVYKVYDDKSQVGRAHNIFIEKDNLFIATNSHVQYGRIALTALDIGNNPEKPSTIQHLSGPIVDEESLFNVVHDVFVKDGLMYCSVGNEGLYLYQIEKEKKHFELVSSLTSYPSQGYNHSSWSTEDGKFLVMADETHGTSLKLVDVSNPLEMEVLDEFGSRSELGTIPHNPFILGDKCFVAYYHEGLVVYDISDPSNVVMADSFDTYPYGADTLFDGYEGCWGAYPYFSSGAVVASDMMNGLFIFKTKNWDSPLKPKIESPKGYIARFSQETFSVRFEELYQGKIQWEVFSVDGRMIHRSDKNFLGTHFSETIDLPSRGLYFLRFHSQLGTHSFKTIFHGQE